MGAPPKVSIDSGNDAPPITSAPQTRYMAMSTQANQIPKKHELGAICSAWITLAGYVVLPSTFTSLKNATSLEKTASGKMVQDAVQNIGLLNLASVLCCIGMAGNCYLWYRWHPNYVWLNSRIFVPVGLNSLIGMITTLLNVFFAQGGHFSPSAKVTVAVTAALSGCMLALYGVHSYLIEKMLTPQDREVAQHGLPSSSSE